MDGITQNPGRSRFSKVGFGFNAEPLGSLLCDHASSARAAGTDTVSAPYKFNLDFGSPPGELSYCLWLSSNYICRYGVCGIFQGGWNLKSQTYSGRNLAFLSIQGPAAELCVF